MVRHDVDVCGQVHVDTHFTVNCMYSILAELELPTLSMCRSASMTNKQRRPRWYNH